jgi:hypothetical protein
MSSRGGRDERLSPQGQHAQRAAEQARTRELLLEALHERRVRDDRRVLAGRTELAAHPHFDGAELNHVAFIDPGLGYGAPVDLGAIGGGEIDHLRSPSLQGEAGAGEGASFAQGRNELRAADDEGLGTVCHCIRSNPASREHPLPTRVTPNDGILEAPPEQHREEARNRVEHALSEARATAVGAYVAAHPLCAVGPCPLDACLRELAGAETCACLL